MIVIQTEKSQKKVLSHLKIKMKPFVIVTLPFLLLFAGCHDETVKQAHTFDRSDIPRTVSITFDDLPVVGISNLSDRKQITKDLLEKITRYDIPAVGFVNEGKLYDPDLEPEEVALLESWLDAGLELANHSYSHLRFDTTPLVEFKKDVLRGEIVTRRLLEERDIQMRYFRHPFLNTGNNPDKISAFNEFLAEHNYITAPVSIDNSDWFYNRAYSNALLDRNEQLANRIADDYVRYMEVIFRHVEQFTHSILGREPAQILLLHANRLNADHFHRIAELIADLGYGFVTLEEALADSVYQMPWIYNEPSTLRGLTRRWQEMGGDSLANRPAIPDWVAEVAERGGN